MAPLRRRPALRRLCAGLSVQRFAYAQCGAPAHVRGEPGARGPAAGARADAAHTLCEDPCAAGGAVPVLRDPEDAHANQAGARTGPDPAGRAGGAAAREGLLRAAVRLCRPGHERVPGGGVSAEARVLAQPQLPVSVNGGWGRGVPRLAQSIERVRARISLFAVSTRRSRASLRSPSAMRWCTLFWSGCASVRTMTPRTMWASRSCWLRARTRHRIRCTTATVAWRTAGGICCTPSGRPFRSGSSEWIWCWVFRMQSMARFFGLIFKTQ